MAEVKICGLTRAGDAELAARLGASYVGVVFAESPRRVDAAQARDVFEALPPTGVRRAGVFSRIPVDRLLETAAAVPLDVLQLHDDFRPEEIAAIRARFGGAVWTVLHVGPGGLLPGREWVFDVSDGVVLDAWSPHRLGGTGRTFQWTEIAAEVARRRGAVRLIVAGGLRPDNVGAVRVLRPDVVDVSSGVESAPGVKDPARLRAFIESAGRLP